MRKLLLLLTLSFTLVACGPKTDPKAIAFDVAKLWAKGDWWVMENYLSSRDQKELKRLAAGVEYKYLLEIKKHKIPLGRPQALSEWKKESDRKAEKIIALEKQSKEESSPQAILKDKLGVPGADIKDIAITQTSMSPDGTTVLACTQAIIVQDGRQWTQPGAIKLQKTDEGWKVPLVGSGVKAPCKF